MTDKVNKQGTPDHTELWSRKLGSLENSYGRGIEMGLTHYQKCCATCGLWKVWVSGKTGEVQKECQC
jgi:hypothetical protein